MSEGSSSPIEVKESEDTEEDFIAIKRILANKNIWGEEPGSTDKLFIPVNQNQILYDAMAVRRQARAKVPNPDYRSWAWTIATNSDGNAWPSLLRIPLKNDQPAD
jgi:hypothetical protein